MSLATSAKIDELLNFLSPTSYEMARRQGVYNEWVESAEAITGMADNVDAIAHLSSSGSGLAFFLFALKGKKQDLTLMVYAVRKAGPLQR
ncbi:hypothetical protein [Rheinheimera baltica]|uniref:hypothetical protein n=1 Tax=Rheinheimera baltica TaxID=67576 RepID=UPI00273FD221|nr:hypothetical protein [Rheinheimera baltica]MDP5148657.1 hypothetical protein [Rheinheimera baltica]